MAQASSEDLAYLGGMFDGEGSIGILTARRNAEKRSKSHRLYCRLGMCNPYIPQLFELNFGGYSFQHKSSNPRHKDVWYWQIEGRYALTFCQAMLPYLRLKRNEAELGIKFYEGIRQKQLGRGNKLTEEELAIREAQRITMSALKDKTKLKEVI